MVETTGVLRCRRRGMPMFLIAFRVIRARESLPLGALTLPAPPMSTVARKSATGPSAGSSTGRGLISVPIEIDNGGIVERRVWWAERDRHVCGNWPSRSIARSPRRCLWPTAVSTKCSVRSSGRSRSKCCASWSSRASWLATTKCAWTRGAGGFRSRRLRNWRLREVRRRLGRTGTRRNARGGCSPRSMNRSHLRRRSGTSRTRIWRRLPIWGSSRSFRRVRLRSEHRAASRVESPTVDPRRRPLVRQRRLVHTPPHRPRSAAPLRFRHKRLRLPTRRNRSIARRPSVARHRQ